MEIPAQYHRIVQNTLDLKNDIDFGMAYNRVEAGYETLLGARAYQRAVNRFQRDLNDQIRRENNSGGQNNNLVT